MNTFTNDHAYWVYMLEKIARPVLAALAAGKLKATMPVETARGEEAHRRKVTHLEALGRTLAGIAPWLETGSDANDRPGLRQELAELSRRAIANAVDPGSPDFLNFREGGDQPVVDAAFLSHAIVRAPRQLVDRLESKSREQLADALTVTRMMPPYYNNHLLFSALVEIALSRLGRQCDLMRLDYAIQQHEQWYVGDGVYADGPLLRCDYYNSFVIHPMLLDVIEAAVKLDNRWQRLVGPMVERARRHAAVLERLVSPEGTLPPVGRSLVYRCAALHLLGQMALRKQLPAEISAAQVRGAMSAVIHKTMDAPGTFDANGWLTIGFCGHQPALGEGYISTGSLYHCAVGLLPLGLPVNDEFWTAPAVPWTSQRIYSGANVPGDHAL